MSPLAVVEAEDVFDIVLPPRPYPGLRPFRKDEWPIFFGRERMTDEVIARLAHQRFLVVHGDSGCGKSSLIRAGVLPRLEQEAARGGARWLTCSATPGDQPLRNFARALAGLDGREHDEARVVEFRRALNCGRDGAAALVHLLEGGNDEHVCILLDQFEEIFAHARRKGSQEAGVLIDLLIGIQQLASPSLCAVLTMRSEFLGACAQFKGFAEAVNATQYLLPRMAHADLVRAIREPALLYDGEVTLELAERLIIEAGGGQDQLPLVQHGLMLLHRDQVLRGSPSGAAPASVADPQWRMTLGCYHGEGLETLLSDHADELMHRAGQANAAGGHGARVVEDLFRALTEINADGQAIRRPQKLERLIAVTGADESSLRAIIDAFRADGVSFLRPYGAEPIALADYVDISHETLIRCWRRIADPHDGWLIREFKNGLVWRSLLVQADSFDASAENILSPATTEERNLWLKRRNEAWSERYGGGWPRVLRLIEASVAECRRRQHEEEDERRRTEEARIREQQLQAELTLAKEKGRRERMFRAGFVLVLFLSLVAVGLALWAQRKSEIASEEGARLAAALDGAELRRRVAESRSQEAEEALAVLTETAANLVVAAAKPTSNGKADTIAEAQNSLSQQVAKLRNVTRIPPRIYIHIANEAQRTAASDLQLRIGQTKFGDDFVYAPGVQLVKANLRSSVLRCFRREECQSDGARLLEVINAQLSSPKVVLQDMSGRYDRSSAIRERHYELWFAPGEITLSSKTGRKY